MRSFAPALPGQNYVAIDLIVSETPVEIQVLANADQAFPRPPSLSQVELRSQEYLRNGE
jgi:hypothetical protein